MDSLIIIGIIAYVAALVSFAAIAVATTRQGRFHSYTSWFLLAVGCLVSGWWFAALATPDWNPISMLALYVPFLILGVFAAAKARRFGTKRA